MKALLAPFLATVINVTDGDTVKVRVEDCRPEVLCEQAVRALGIDTPESHMPPAKCPAEKAKGLAAALYARGLLKPGQRVRVQFVKWDKYGGRFDGSIELPDGRDFALTMIASGRARAYDGGKKGSWCP